MAVLVFFLRKGVAHINSSEPNWPTVWINLDPNCHSYRAKLWPFHFKLAVLPLEDGSDNLYVDRAPTDFSGNCLNLP